MTEPMEKMPERLTKPTGRVAREQLRVAMDEIDAATTALGLAEGPDHSSEATRLHARNSDKE